jgi:hypothetical protein
MIYDGIAAEYAVHARTGVYNALYDRPAVLGYITQQPDVVSLRHARLA